MDVYVLSTAASRSRLFWDVPHSNPDPVGAELAPVKEADRVAPVALTLEVEPVVTVAVRPPGVPPPDSLQLANL